MKTKHIHNIKSFFQAIRGKHTSTQRKNEGKEKGKNI